MATSDLLGLVLARAVFVPSIANFLEELMDVKGMDLFEVEVPRSLVGETYARVLSKLKEEKDVTVVGLVRDQGMMANPPGSIKLIEGDKLLVISEEKPNL